MVERIDALPFGLRVSCRRGARSPLRRRPCRAARTCPGTSSWCRHGAAGRAAAPERRPCGRGAASPPDPCRSNRASPAAMLGESLAHDVDALGLQPVEMGQRAHRAPPSRQRRKGQAVDPGALPRFILPQYGLRHLPDAGQKARKVLKRNAMPGTHHRRADPGRAVRQPATPRSRIKAMSEGGHQGGDQRQAGQRLCRHGRRP